MGCSPNLANSLGLAGHWHHPQFPFINKQSGFSEHVVARRYLLLWHSLTMSATKHCMFSAVRKRGCVEALTIYVAFSERTGRGVIVMMTPKAQNDVHGIIVPISGYYEMAIAMIINANDLVKGNVYIKYNWEYSTCKNKSYKHCFHCFTVSFTYIWCTDLSLYTLTHILDSIVVCKSCGFCLVM